MSQQFANAARGQLALAVDATDTTFTLVSGDSFPVADGTSWFFAVLEDQNGIEIVRVNNRSSNVLTVLRGQQGTTSRSFPAGAVVGHRVTAQDMQSLAPLFSPAFTGVPSAPTAAAGDNTTQLATTAFVDTALTNERTATVTLTNKTLAGLREVRVAMPASNIDLATGNLFTRTISSSTTFTVSNVPAAGTVASFILDLTNGGSATITWWPGIKWAGGTPPTLTAAGRDALGFFTHDGGINWTGVVLGLDVK